MMHDPDLPRGPNLYVSFETPGMADDLEWALQSSQADTVLAAEALLHAFYAPMYQITQALGLSEAEAGAILRGGFAAALRQRYRYRSGMDIPRWFYGAALSALPRKVRHDAWPPLAAVLRAYTPLRAERIAAFLNAPVRQVNAFLHKIDRHPADALIQAGWTVDEAFAAELAGNWRAAFRNRFPAPQVNETELEVLAHDMAALAERRTRIFQRTLALRETLLILLAIGVMGLLALAANLFIPDSGSATPTPTAKSVKVIITQELVETRIVYVTATPQSTLQPAISPTPRKIIGMRTRRGLIEERMRSSATFWNTIWGDATIFIAGDENLSRPDLRLRAQYWSSYNRLRLHLGLQNSAPAITVIGNNKKLIWMNSAYQAYDIPFKRLTYKTKISFPATFPMLPISLDIPTLPELIPGDLVPTREEYAGGQPALLILATEQNTRLPMRAWLDQNRAVPLRLQIIKPDNPNAFLIDMQVHQVEYDAPFQTENLFFTVSPHPANAWTDIDGDPLNEPLDKQALSFGPQPTQSSSDKLQIIYQGAFDPFTAYAPANVSFNGQSKGSLIFGNPYTVVCARSSDAQWLAFYAHPLFFRSNDTDQVWLYQLKDFTSPLIGQYQGLTAYRMSFSPDQQRLAVFGEMQGFRGLYIISVMQPALPPRYLGYINDADALVWASDQSFIGWFDDNEGKGGVFNAVDPKSGEMVMNTSYDGDGSQKDFGVQRPPELDGIAACR